MIKFAEGVLPEEPRRKERQGINYSGASWKGNTGPNSVGRRMSPREALRASVPRSASWPVGDPRRVLESASVKRTGPTGALMREPVSYRTSKPERRRKIKAFARKIQRQQEAAESVDEPGTD